MKKTSNILNFGLRILLIAFVVIYIIFSPLVFIPKLSTKNFLQERENINYKIIELWNIDTFEGGSVSRTRFLERCAVQYEKQHKGQFFMIKNMTVSQAISNLENSMPSYISYVVKFTLYLVYIEMTKYQRGKY